MFSCCTFKILNIDPGHLIQLQISYFFTEHKKFHMVEFCIMKNSIFSDEHYDNHIIKLMKTCSTMKHLIIKSRKFFRGESNFNIASDILKCTCSMLIRLGKVFRHLGFRDISSI